MDQESGKRIFQIVRELDSAKNGIFRPIYEKNGLTVIQARLLMTIRRQKIATVGTIAERLEMACGNVSVLCKRLEKEELLFRERAAEDERIVRIHLTPKAQMLLQKIEKEVLEYYSAIWKEVSKEDLDSMIAGLEKLNIIIRKMQEFNKKGRNKK